METAAFVLGLVGVVMAAISLGWQIAIFQMSGPRVRVHFREGVRGPMGIMIAPLSVYTDDGLEALREQGYTEHVVAIQAVNIGRSATTVKNWNVRFGNSVSYGNQVDPRNPGLPYRLEPHTSEMWLAPVSNLEVLQAAFVDQGDHSATAVGEIDLASGRTAASLERLMVRMSGVEIVRPAFWHVRRRVRSRT